MMNEDLRGKLKNKLVSNGVKLAMTKKQKATMAKAQNDLIKKLTAVQEAIIEALDVNDEEVLVGRFGDFYRNELGLGDQ